MLMPRETRRPLAAAVAAVTLSGLLLAGGAALAEIDVGDAQLATKATNQMANIVKVKAKPAKHQIDEIHLAEIDLAETDLESSLPPRPQVTKTARPPIHVQCWQEGVKIIDETGLSEIALSNILPQVSRSNLIDGGTTGLKGRDDEGGKFLIVSVREATCLVRDAS